MKSKLLLLHGALGSKDQFTSISEKLTPEFEIFDLNFSGHGSNPVEVDFSIDQFVQEVMFFLELHNLSSIHIFGYSMGGYVALKLAQLHHDRVDKIMTLATKFEWTKESADKEIKMLSPDLIEEKIPRFAEELKMRHLPNDWKLMMRKTSKMMAGLGNGEAMQPWEFASIKNHSLIAVGQEDKMVSIKESQAIADLLQDAALMVIPGFKHPIETMDVDTLSSIIINFFIP